MAKYSNTKAKINEKITTNGVQSVTGSILNEVLQTMVDSLGADYQFGGLAQPGSAFTAGEQPVVFVATTPGTYTNFGGIVVADGEVALLVWSGSAWSKQTPDIATRTEVSQLGQKLHCVDTPDSDFSISDGAGHDILQLKNGGIKTKNFDSEKTPVVGDTTDPDFSISDPDGNEIARFEKGFVRTKQGINTLWGKRFSIMGDSISTYSGMLALDWLISYYPQGDVQNYLDTWWGKLISKYGMILDKNDASSGSFVSGTDQFAMCSDQRLAALGYHPDYILFMGGTNDFLHNKDIGEFVNDGTFNPLRNTDFANAYAYCLYKMKMLYPNSKIVCITIPEPNSLDTEMLDFYPCKSTIGKYLYEYNDVIRETAKMMACSICDITDVLNYFSAQQTHIEETYGSDHAYVHPNKKGMEMIADRIAKVLNFNL